MKYGDIKLYAGTACPELANRISTHMGLPLMDRDIIKFPNDNLFVKLHSSVRGQDCYIIQTTSAPVHRNLMELFDPDSNVAPGFCGSDHCRHSLPLLARSDKKDQPAFPYGSSGGRYD